MYGVWIPEELNPSGPRYLALADAIDRDVRTGRLRGGDQLPPQRDLAAQLGLNLTTITRAYREAAQRGLLQGAVGRGSYVRERSAGGGAIDLSLNFPPPALMERATRAMRDGLVRLARRPDLSELGNYGDNAGRASHRAAGITWARMRGVDASAERVVITAGGQHALLAILLATVKSGEAILVEALTFSHAKSLFQQLGLKPIAVALGADGIDPNALRAACAGSKAKVLYTIPTLHNPTTAVMPHARRKEIAEVARQHDLLVIEDDCYGGLLDEAPAPLAALIPERSYFVTGLSKTLLPGLRIAHVVAPTPAAAEAVTRGVTLSCIMAPPLMAEIAARWIEDGTAAELLAHNREDLQQRYELVMATLGDLECRSHPHSHHAWLELPEPWTSSEFVAACRARNVLVAPAEAFAVDQAPAAVRLSVASPAPDDLRQALTVIRQLLASAPDRSFF